MKFDYPKDAEGARARIVEWLNRILKADESFALALGNTRLPVSPAIMEAEGKDEVQLVIGKERDFGWNSSFIGVLNGALEVLGCGCVAADVHMTSYNPPTYPITKIDQFRAFIPGQLEDGDAKNPD